MVGEPPRPVQWLGSTLDDMKEMPLAVRRVFGFALYQAQMGGKHEDAKPSQGFGGAGVLEVIENHESDTYRAVYTVRYEEAIYVLHVFKKKSKQGIKTPQADINTIRTRQQQAQRRHEEYLKGIRG